MDFSVPTKWIAHKRKFNLSKMLTFSHPLLRFIEGKTYLFTSKGGCLPATFLGAYKTGDVTYARFELHYLRRFKNVADNFTAMEVTAENCKNIIPL